MGTPYPRGTQQQIYTELSARRCCCRSTGQTDGQTPDRYIGPAPPTMRADCRVNNGQWA